MKLITFYYFSKFVQMVIILKHLKQAGLNLTVVLITDYCQTLKHSHHKIHTTKKLHYLKKFSISPIYWEQYKTHWIPNSHTNLFPHFNLVQIKMRKHIKINAPHIGERKNLNMGTN